MNLIFERLYIESVLLGRTLNDLVNEELISKAATRKGGFYHIVVIGK